MPVSVVCPQFLSLVWSSVDTSLWLWPTTLPIMTLLYGPQHNMTILSESSVHALKQLNWQAIKKTTTTTTQEDLLKGLLLRRTVLKTSIRSTISHIWNFTKPLVITPTSPVWGAPGFQVEKLLRCISILLIHIPGHIPLTDYKHSHDHTSFHFSHRGCNLKKKAFRIQSNQ